MTKIEKFEDKEAWREARVSDEADRLVSGFIKYLLGKGKMPQEPTELNIPE